MKTKQRDYLFDNYKVFLIVLVVVGHFIEPNYTNNSFLYGLKWLIVSFHMPAFIFVSGYFSKKNLSAGTIIQKLLVPYLVYEAIYYVFYIFVLHKNTTANPLYPKFSLWYLLALFAWRAITPYVKKIPGYFVLSVLAGLLIGCSSMKDNFLSIPRILVFYPFFLLGTNFQREWITRMRDTTCRMLALAMVIITGAFLVYGPFSQYSIPKIFYGRYNYDFLGQSVAEGMLCRLACYAIGFVLTFAFLILLPEKQNRLSYIGTRTMAIYLFHGLTYSYLKECTTILKDVNTLEESLLLIAGCICLVGIFSIPQLTTFTNRISSLKFPHVGSSISVWYPQSRQPF